MPAEAINTSGTNVSPISEEANTEIATKPSMEPQNSDTSNSDQASLSPMDSASTSASLQASECSESESSQCDMQSKNRDETQTASEFLPDKSYYYNARNSYVFPGAELWWKDSDNESVSSDSSSGDDDDVTDMEIDNIRNELEQSYSAQENSQLNSTYDMFFSNEQAQKDNDSSSCSSNQYDSTTDSSIVQTIDYTFTSSTVTTAASVTTHSRNATTSTQEAGSQNWRKRNVCSTGDDAMSSGSIETTGVENVQKRMKFSDMLSASNQPISSSETSEN